MVTSTSSSGSSIVNTLNAGSGIDITSLVSSLIDAQFTPKTQTLNDQNSKLTTQISAVGTLKSSLTDFATGLSQIVSGGSLVTAPTSSNTNIVKATGISGKSASGLAASVEVRQLATAQVATSNPIGDATAAIGTGTLTLTLGTATVSGGAITGFAAGSGAPINITIDSSNSSLQGIAKAINAAKAGVTATILTDADGARLSLKGSTGAAQAFTLTATEDSGAPGLAALNVGVGASGTTVGSTAQDAIVAVDGVALKRPTNSISDLISGVKLDLVAASPGTIVSLGNATPTDTIATTVSNFVSTYNELHNTLKADLDAKTGSLFGDPAATSLNRALGRFTLTKLATTTTTGAPTTLAEIGVATNRDGTLSVNTTQLNAAIANYPDAVEALFADGSGATGGGISAAFNAIVTSATSNSYGLGASTTRYTKAQDTIATELDKLATQRDATQTRLTQQFSNSDAQISAYKQTQSQLTQQIAQWNKSGN
jgi:flagellar hook-associated protein 2